MRYSINLIRSLRLKEKKAEEKRVLTSTLSMICLSLLILSIFYTTIQILTMKGQLKEEETKLNRIEEEYREYKETQMSIDKSDIELLDKLQHSRIFWSKKIAAMAQHLPDNYWVTQFGYKSDNFGVEGYGYITKKQKQLITMDDYLNLLRNDSTFNDIFKNTYLDMTKREDDKHAGKKVEERISFKYSALGKVDKKL